MLFKLKHISKHYGSELDGTLRKVLDELFLEVHEGESIAILGPSGSGKTTLLNIMGTLDRPDSGDVFFRDSKSGQQVEAAKSLENKESELKPTETEVTDDEITFENLSGGLVENETLKDSLSFDFEDFENENIDTSARDEESENKNDSSEDVLSENISVLSKTNSENIPVSDIKSELRSAPRPIVKHVYPYPKAEIQSSRGNNITPKQFSPFPVTFSSKENLVNYTTKELDTFRNQKIGFVFQIHHLLPQCTLLENILIPTLTITDKKIKAEKLARARELMERVGIWGQRDQMPGHLSGGECQRAAVVRALINKPGLLLADEPTGALDEDNVSKLAMLLLEINKTDGVTLVIVTHSVALAAKMDTVYELRNGKLRLKNLKA